jgi:diaminopimelate epimerase
MKFFKFSALGNGFVVVPTLRDAKGPERDEARRICDAKDGVAADGVVYVHELTGRVHIYNADGSRAKLSGNGARCAAAWWFTQPVVRSRTVTWTTDAGPVTCTRKSGAIEVEIAPPEFAADAVPVNWPNPELWGERLAVGGSPKRSLKVYALSVGNPQTVVWVKSFPRHWPALGAAIQKHRAFPDRTNVVFALRGSRRIEARLFERGAGETLSSGTGAAAAVVAGARLGLCGRKTNVNMPGGTMNVEWTKAGPIKLTCPVVEIARGEIKTGSRKS